MVCEIDSIFDERKVGSISDDRELILSLLKTYRKKLSKTQVQKLLFLLSVTEEINLPFRFTKHNYGPYSKKLVTNLNKLEKENLINIDEYIDSSYGAPQKRVDIVLKDDISVKGELKKMLSNLKSKYDSSASSLTSTCYNDFYLQFHKEKEQDYLKRIQVEINSLKNELEILFESIETSDEFSDKEKFDVLTNLDYLSKVLKSEDLYSIDMVERGIILKKTNEFIDLLRVVLFDKQGRSQDLCNSLSRKFNYLVDRVTFLKIIDSIFSDYKAEA